MIELFAITDDPAPPAPPLRAVRCDGLTALCAPAEPREATPEALWRHEELVEELMAGRDLLPVRYGTLVDDEQAAARAVAERRDELLASLERVRGAVELAVRIHTRVRAESPAVTSGRDYLRAKAGAFEAAKLVHEPLAALARDSVLPHGSEPLRAAYLVDREAVDGFVAEVSRLQSAHPDLDVLCTGPWPPYSFVER